MVDRLGIRWEGEEYHGYQWKFQFRRRSANTNVFNGYWSHHQHDPVQGPITITLQGNRVTMNRSPETGATCTYTGTYKPRDIINGIPAKASGTYTCDDGYKGKWRASIHF